MKTVLLTFVYAAIAVMALAAACAYLLGCVIDLIVRVLFGWM